MVQDGLSQLGISGDGTKLVYLTIALNVSKQPYMPADGLCWMM